MKEKEKEKIKDILDTYNFNKYCQHHIQCYDLTEEIGKKYSDDEAKKIICAVSIPPAGSYLRTAVS